MQRDCQNLGPDAHVVKASAAVAFTSPFVGAAAPNKEDSPSYCKAMKGPDRELWKDAMHSEIANFTNYDVFEEVSEDSLPTWNKQRGSAAEVIDMMWVLVKKYNELREFIKCKARGTVR